MYKKLLKENKLDAILISSPFNMQYICGFKGGEGMVYLSENRQVLITDSRYTESAQKETAFQVIKEEGGGSRFNILSKLLAEDSCKRIGFEDLFLTVGEFNSLRDNLPKELAYVSLGKQVDNLRIVKSKEEIEYMTEAARIADAAFTQILPFIKVGVTELEIAGELEYLMKKEGAGGTSFDTIIASGKNSSLPHAVPSLKKIEAGDFVTMDFGCRVERYCSDMTRTVAVGEVSEKQRQIYDIVLQANLKALEGVRAGKVCSSIDAIARDYIKNAGYGEYFGHGLGHSVGLEIHEFPTFSPRDNTVLSENTVETIEPGIYLPGEFGVRIEDMILVTREGYRLFSKSPKELIIL